MTDLGGSGAPGIGRQALTHAVFDLDGTVHPGALGVLLLSEMHVAAVCRGGAVERLFAFLRHRDEEHLHEPSSVRTAYQLYGRALEGCDARQVEEVADRLWERERGNVFAYVAPVLDELRAQGTGLVLISGSPQEIVEPVARSLGFDHWQGAVLAVEDGRYTGRYSHAPALAGQKVALAAALAGGPEQLARCAAVGNSVSDIELLAAVARPIAFESGPQLTAAARDKGWTVADRTSLSAAMFALDPH